MDISYLLRTGAIGWQVEARGQYAQYVQMHQLQQLLIQINSAKKTRAKKPEKFESLFPTHDALQQLRWGAKKELGLNEKLDGVLMTLGVAENDDSGAEGRQRVSQNI